MAVKSRLAALATSNPASRAARNKPASRRVTIGASPEIDNESMQVDRTHRKNTVKEKIEGRLGTHQSAKTCIDNVDLDNEDGTGGAADQVMSSSVVSSVGVSSDG